METLLGVFGIAIALAGGRESNVASARCWTDFGSNRALLPMSEPLPFAWRFESPRGSGISELVSAMVSMVGLVQR